MSMTLFVEIKLSQLCLIWKNKVPVIRIRLHSGTSKPWKLKRKGAHVFIILIRDRTF